MRCFNMPNMWPGLGKMGDFVMSSIFSITVNVWCWWHLFSDKPMYNGPKFAYVCSQMYSSKLEPIAWDNALSWFVPGAKVDFFVDGRVCCTWKYDIKQLSPQMGLRFDLQFAMVVVACYLFPCLIWFLVFPHHHQLKPMAEWPKICDLFVFFYFYLFFGETHEQGPLVFVGLRTWTAYLGMFDLFFLHGWCAKTTGFLFSFFVWFILCLKHRNEMLLSIPIFNRSSQPLL